LRARSPDLWAQLWATLDLIGELADSLHCRPVQVENVGRSVFGPFRQYEDSSGELAFPVFRDEALALSNNPQFTNLGCTQGNSNFVRATRVEAE